MYVGKVPAQTKTLYSTAKHGYSVIYKHRTGEIIIFVFRKDIKLVVMKQSCASRYLHRETQDICYIFQLLHLYKQMCLKSAFSRYKTKHIYFTTIPCFYKQGTETNSVSGYSFANNVRI